MLQTSQTWLYFLSHPPCLGWGTSRRWLVPLASQDVRDVLYFSTSKVPTLHNISSIVSVCSVEVYFGTSNPYTFAILLTLKLELKSAFPQRDTYDKMASLPACPPVLQCGYAKWLVASTEYAVTSFLTRATSYVAISVNVNCCPKWTRLVFSYPIPLLFLIYDRIFYSWFFKEEQTQLQIDVILLLRHFFVSSVSRVGCKIQLLRSLFSALCSEIILRTSNSL